MHVWKSVFKVFFLFTVEEKAESFGIVITWTNVDVHPALSRVLGWRPQRFPPFYIIPWPCGYMLSVPSKIKVRGRFHQATVISWATATSFAISCSISSGVRSQRGNLTWWSLVWDFFWRVCQSFKQTESILMSFERKKERKERRVGRCSSFQRQAQPFSLWEEGGPKGCGPGAWLT